MRLQLSQRAGPLELLGTSAASGLGFDGGMGAEDDEKRGSRAHVVTNAARCGYISVTRELVLSCWEYTDSKLSIAAGRALDLIFERALEEERVEQATDLLIACWRRTDRANFKDAAVKTLAMTVRIVDVVRRMVSRKERDGVDPNEVSLLRERSVMVQRFASELLGSLTPKRVDDVMQKAWQLDNGRAKLIRDVSARAGESNGWQPHSLTTPPNALLSGSRAPVRHAVCLAHMGTQLTPPSHHPSCRALTTDRRLCASSATCFSSPPRCRASSAGTGRGASPSSSSSAACAIASTASPVQWAGARGLRRFCSRSSYSSRSISCIAWIQSLDHRVVPVFPCPSLAQR